MKSVLSGSKNFLLICWMLLSLAEFSQAQTVRKNDVIVTKNNEKIDAIIQEISASTIKYKKVSDPDGPVFTIEKTEVSSILYGNGEVEKLDKSTDEYFAPGTVPPPVTYKEEPKKDYRGYGGIYSHLSDQQLKSNYNLYLKKASNYKKLGFIGASAGLLFTIIGVVKLSEASNYYYNSSGAYIADDDAIVGALLFTAGLGAGIPLTLVGFIKNNSYKKKALAAQNELRKRNQPLSLRLSPGYNPATNSGYLSLKIAF